MVKKKQLQQKEKKILKRKTKQKCALSNGWKKNIEHNKANNEYMSRDMNNELYRRQKSNISHSIR